MTKFSAAKMVLNMIFHPLSGIANAAQLRIALTIKKSKINLQ